MHVAQISNRPHIANISIKAKNNAPAFGDNVGAHLDFNMGGKDPKRVFSYDYKGACCVFGILGLAVALVVWPLKKLYSAISSGIKKGIERAKAVAKRPPSQTPSGV